MSAGAAIRAIGRWRASSPLPIAVVSSIAIHVALLAASPSLRFDSRIPPSILHVSLIASSGARGNGSGAAAAPALPPPAPEPRSAAEPRARKANPVARRSLPARRKAPPAPAEVAALPSRSPEDVPLAPAVAEQGNGSASSAAVGLGSSADGRGTGSGRGPGGGSGTGGGGDLRVACEYCPAPRYPRTAVARKAEGVVQVGFTLTADGRVSEVQVRSSSGDHELDRAAVDVARRSRFRFAIPVADAARGYLEYQFQLARRGNT